MLSELIPKDAVSLSVGKINWLENGKVINELFKIFSYWASNLLYFSILGDTFFIASWAINTPNILFPCKFASFAIFKVIRDDCSLAFLSETTDFKYKVVTLTTNISIAILAATEVYIILFKYLSWCLNFKSP